ALLTVSEFAGQHRVTHSALAHDLARLSRRVARARRVERLAGDAPGDGWVLFQVLSQSIIKKRFNRSFYIRVELAFCLAFELRLRKFDGDNGYQALAHVVTSKRAFEVLRQPGRLCVSVDGARERR